MHKTIILLLFILLNYSDYSFAQSKPNVVFIFTDDLGYNDIGCYGQKILKTPNIDKLRSQGLKFNRFYSGAPVCAPARCALMTGKNVGNCSVRGNQPKGQLLKSEETTLPEVFKSAGYATGLIGKWGLGNAPEPDDPARNGFDYHYGYVNMWHAHNFYPEFLYRNGEKDYLDNKTGDIPKGNYPEGVGLASIRNTYAPDKFDEEALNFIQKNKDNPFFLFYAMNTPHGNSEYKVDGNGMEVPDTKLFDHTGWNNAEKGFAEMMRRLDNSVGMIMDKLTALNLESNTIVIFTSDNGPHSECNHDPDFFDSNGVLRGQKRDLYEGGIRVPFIIKYPGVVQPNTTTDQVMALWDILPTMAAVTGQKAPKGISGISYLPTFTGKRKQNQPKYLYWEFYEENGKQAVLWREWKGIRFNTNLPTKMKFELYNLKEDESETKNVASKNPNIQKKIEKMMAQAHIPFPLTSLFNSDPTAQRDVQKQN